MSLSELIRREEVFGEFSDAEVGRPTAIPTEVRDGDLYIILKNEENAYIPPRGRPVATVVGDAVRVPEEIGTVLRTAEPRRLSARIFARFWGVETVRARVIGITGTAGKTTTARMLEAILRHDGHRVGYIGTGRIAINGDPINEKYYSMTTPDPWLLYKSLAEMEEAGCDVVVMEVSSHSLALAKVDAIKFKLGVFTNLTPEHLDFHGDMESYFGAKLRLAELSEKMLWQLDDAYGRRGAALTGGVGAGALWAGDYRVTDLEDHGLDGSRYIFRGNGFSFIQKLKLPGIYNVYNAMLATAAAIELGVRPCVVKECLRDFSSPEGRYEVIKDEITVIIDYAHTATALENLLKSLKSTLNSRQKLTLVFGAGGERDREKRPEMARIAEKYADLTIVTDDNPRREDPDAIVREIVAGFAEKRYKVIRDRRLAILSAVLDAHVGDVVALVGKGAERYAIDARGYRDFDEPAIAREALSRRCKE